MKKLIVMDYITKAITIYPYDENVWESPEDYETEDGEQPLDSNTNYMVVNFAQIRIV